MDKLTYVIRRTLMRHGVSVDPFSLMELATLIKPALRGGGRQASIESAVEFLAGLLERSYVEEAGRVAESVVREVVEYCRRSGCG